MVKHYRNGEDFLRDNTDFLNTNPYLSSFFFLDAPLLVAADKINYALRVEGDGDPLLALKVEPYSLLLFGFEGAVRELSDFLIQNGYEIKGMLGSEVVCDALCDVLKTNYGIVYREALAMDFMEATEKSAPSSADVTVPTEDDLDEIVGCLCAFISECGLTDTVDAERTKKTLSAFRVLRADGKIVSMAKISPMTKNAARIAAVYTRPEYRGRGYAGRVVNAAKNEILDRNMTATLNVDKKNPISNRLYASLGFTKVFSQGEYRRQKTIF